MGQGAAKAMNRWWALLPLTGAVLFTGCATVPTGPSVMVLPGTGKPFEQFQVDDASCRGWAAQQAGITTGAVGDRTTLTGAVIGTAVGAAAGAALGAAAGNPAIGAAAGAGVGLLGGTAIGAGEAAGAVSAVQRRYDAGYMQCMYAKGNRIPVSRGSQAYSASPPPSPPPPPPPPPAPAAPPANAPPPPPGPPPPPPPNVTR